MAKEVFTITGEVKRLVKEVFTVTGEVKRLVKRSIYRHRRGETSCHEKYLPSKANLILDYGARAEVQLLDDSQTTTV